MENIAVSQPTKHVFMYLWDNCLRWLPTVSRKVRQIQVLT